MIIAIDASRAVNEKAGVGRYTKQLIENLLEIDSTNQYRLFFNFRSDYKNKKEAAEKFKRKNSKIIITKIPGTIKERLLGSRIDFYRGKLKDCNVFFAPTFLDVDLSLKIPQIVVIHDLTMFNFPKHLGEKLSRYFQKRVKLAVEKTHKIISVSFSTKNDLIKILNVNPNKIKVIYPGLNRFKKLANKLPDNLESKKYILSVGTLEPRKNLKNLLAAYHLLPFTIQQKYPLVIAGGEGWHNEEMEKEIKDKNLKTKIKLLGYQPDEVLAKLYKEAKVFVYPSLYEGFGFPIIEAMQFGTLVIASNLSSMPEVGGKAALYVKPEDPKSISKLLMEVLMDKIDIVKLKKLGQINIAKFSWEKAARDTLNLLREIYPK